MKRLTALAVALALAITACGTDDPDDDPGAEPDPTGTDEPQTGGTYTTIISRINATAPINPFAPDSNSFLAYNAMQLGWLKNDLTDPNQFYPGLAESWEVSADNLELTVNLHPDATWSDGTPVTSDDVVLSSNIAYTRGAGAFILAPGAAGTASEVEVVDDKTITFTQSAERPTGTFVNGIMQLIIVPAHIYGEVLPADFAETLEAARGEGAEADAAREAISGISEAVVSFAPETDVSAGPFVLERVNPSEALLTKNENFHNADVVAPDQVVVRNFTGNEQVWDFLLAGELDSAPFTAVPADTMTQIEAVPGNVVSRSYSPVVAGLAFNQSHEPYDDIRVRRALAHILDRAQMVEIGTPEGGAAAVNTSGIHQEAADAWLGAEFGQLDPYALDLDGAEQELLDAGFTKDGDTWLLPDGEEWTVRIQVVAGFSDWIAAGENAATQLNEYGISAETVTSPDFTIYQEEMAAGEYDLGFWLIGLGPSAYNIFQRLYGQANGWQVLAGQLTYNAPGENGNWMGGSETLDVEGVGEVNPGELAHELNLADEDRQREIMAILAKTTNQHLPVIQMWDYINTQFFNTTKFEGFPDDDSDALRLRAGVWMQQGWISSK